jgi:hypothetical protein
MGTFLTYTLAGGDAGMRHFMAQFGPALQLPWTYLPAPELTDKLIDDVVDGTSDQLGKHSISALERYRDDCLLAVLEAVKTTKEKHGMSFQRVIAFPMRGLPARPQAVVQRMLSEHREEVGAAAPSGASRHNLLDGVPCPPSPPTKPPSSPTGSTTTATCATPSTC